MDKELTYDFSKLDLEELIELRGLQLKMRQATGSIEGYEALSVPELKVLERMYYKMAGLEYPGDCVPHYVTVIGREFTDAPDSGVAPASASAPAEPVAVAPAAAPAKPAAPATPAPAEKLKLPSDSAPSAARQLDAILRFGA